MPALLDHPILGPAYTDLAQACLHGRELADWTAREAAGAVPVGLDEQVQIPAGSDPGEGRRRGLFKR